MREIDLKLFDAIEKKDVQLVKKLISKGANPNARNYQTLTPLAVATSYGTEMVNLLIKSGAKVNDYFENEGLTPLHWALSRARTEREKVIQILLEKKANVNARSKQGKTFITSTDLSGPNPLGAGFRLSGQTPLFNCLWNWDQDQKVIDLLIKYGADIKAKDDNDWSLLHHSMIQGTPNTVKSLLKKGLDPNAQSKQGLSPLHVAMKSGFGVPDIEKVKILLAAGANPTLKNKDGQTPDEVNRADVQQLFTSLRFNKSVTKVFPEMRVLLTMNDQVRKLLKPEAPAFVPEDPPLIDGWREYAPIDRFGGLGWESSDRIRVKVKMGPEKTILSLQLESSSREVPTYKISNLELNQIEPLELKPLELSLGKELLVEFPPTAGEYGGVVAFEYRFVVKDASGSGNIGGPVSGPSVGLSFQATQSKTEWYLVLFNAFGPIEVRIDELKVDGVVQKSSTGKTFVLKPSPDSSPRMQLTQQTKDGKKSEGIERIFSSDNSPKRVKDLKVKFSYRVIGNKKWRTASL